jgi:exoribonuclease R
MDEAISSGKIEQRRGQFYIQNTDIRLERNELTPNLLPGDTVRINPDIKTPIELLEREDIFTLGIIRGFHSGKCYLYCPLLISSYNPSVIYNKAKIGTRLMILIRKNVVDVIKDYGSIQDRSKDWYILKDYYNSQCFQTFKTCRDFTQCFSNDSGSGYYTKEFQNQVDLPTFTIDPVQSKDFDDAISVIEQKDISTGLIHRSILIHIVDANRLIPCGSQMDSRAFELGFTLYSPENNMNILLDKYAEDEFSLIEGKPRYVITVEMKLKPIPEDSSCNNFEMISYEIYPSLIQVKNRYNYENVPKMEFLEEYTKWVISREVSRKDLCIPSLRLEVDSRGKVVNYRTESNRDMNHRMIEVLMISANSLVSYHLQKYCGDYHYIPQRFHNTNNRKYLSMDSGDETQWILRSLYAIQSFNPASYEIHKTGHEGLGLESYTHFTSPIRRYFDVLIHRMLAGNLHIDSRNEEIFSRMLNHLNSVEKLNDNLQKLYKHWKLLSLIHVGMEWEVYIYNVSSRGVNFVYLPLMYTGYIPVKDIKDKDGNRIQWLYRSVDEILVSSIDSGMTITREIKMKSKIYEMNPITNEIRIELYC